MIFDDAEGPLLQDLSLLRPLSPDPARAERVRARCRARLERTRRSEHSTTIPEFFGCVLAPLVLGCLCGFYIVDLLGIALRLRDLFD